MVSPLAIRVVVPDLGTRVPWQAMARGSRIKLFVAPPADKPPGSKHGDVVMGSLKVGGADGADIAVFLPLSLTFLRAVF